MKKTVLILLLVLVIFFASCAQNVVQLPDEPTTTETTMTTEATTEPVAEISFQDLPIHNPEDIQLASIEDVMGSYGLFVPSYRIVFYSIDTLFIQLVDMEHENWDEMDRILAASGTREPEEMNLVALVRLFGIERADFERALIQQRLNTSHFFGAYAELSEGLELPCPDIIFTFDNEIINAFYRRENPVAPDWWPLGEADGVRTFSSYLALRAANPQ